MPEPATAPPPSAQVPPAELPASVREAGLANWIREPLDDAVDRRRRVIVPPAVATMGTALSGCQGALMAQARGPDALVMMGDNPALPKMPERPTLKDFFALRLSKTGTNHMLQSATLAREHGLDEKVIMACLVHDIAIAGLISANHGYWGAQMVAPYVDEEVAWAIQKHEGLRYFADESVGYRYPQAYIEYFGQDYRPPAYLCREAEEARKHRWYMTSADHDQRHQLVRPQHRRGLQRVRGRAGPQLPPARGGARLRRLSRRAHVADDDLAEQLPLAHGLVTRFSTHGAGLWQPNAARSRDRPGLPGTGRDPAGAVRHAARQTATGEFAQSTVSSRLGFAGLTATFRWAPRLRLATFATGTRFMKTASIGLEPSIGSSAFSTYTGSLGSGSAGFTSPTVLPDGENSRRTAVIRWPVASRSAAERRCTVCPPARISAAACSAGATRELSAAAPALRRTR